MDLVTDGKPDAAKIGACREPVGELIAALTDADDARAAAAAIVLGIRGDPAATAPLLEWLGDPDLRGRAAAWALGRLGAGMEVLDALAGAKLGVRENGYRALAVQVAAGGADPELAAGLRRCVDEEIARSEAGGMGLGDQACRVLAMLGDEAVPDLCDRIIAADDYADKFELQRLRKAMDADGRDREGLDEFAAPWETAFADDLAGAPAAEASPPEVSPLVGEDGGGGPPQRPAPDAVEADGPAAGEAGPEAEAPTDEAEGQAGPPPPRLDWQGYLDAADLDPAKRQVVQRIGPTLEQLAQMSVGAELTQLRPDEFAALVLQVVPQALGPQVAQALLAPEMLNVLQRAAAWFRDQGEGDGLLLGVKRLREVVREQIRASGMLGGPDYSDPDEVVEG